jgi:hypothetical protein
LSCLVLSCRVVSWRVVSCLVSSCLVPLSYFLWRRLVWCGVVLSCCLVLLPCPIYSGLVWSSLFFCATSLPLFRLFIAANQSLLFFTPFRNMLHRLSWRRFCPDICPGFLLPWSLFLVLVLVFCLDLSSVFCLGPCVWSVLVLVICVEFLLSFVFHTSGVWKLTVPAFGSTPVPACLHKVRVDTLLRDTFSPASRAFQEAASGASGESLAIADIHIHPRFSGRQDTTRQDNTKTITKTTPTRQHQDKTTPRQHQDSTTLNHDRSFSTCTMTPVPFARRQSGALLTLQLRNGWIVTLDASQVEEGQKENAPLERMLFKAPSQQERPAPSPSNASSSSGAGGAVASDRRAAFSLLCAYMGDHHHPGARSCVGGGGFLRGEQNASNPVYFGFTTGERTIVVSDHNLQQERLRPTPKDGAKVRAPPPVSSRVVSISRPVDPSGQVVFVFSFSYQLKSVYRIVP